MLQDTKMYDGFSLHLGLNKVNPAAYGGWSGQLWGCHNDAEAMFRIADSLDYNTTLLLSEQATLAKVKEEILLIRDTMSLSDVFLLTYSGHGGQVPDFSSEEEDKMDETWCLYDGQLIDDELYGLLKTFPSRSRIIVVSDSCHSGTVVREAMHNSRGMPSALVPIAYGAQKEYYDSIGRIDKTKYEMSCTVCLLSGCQDNQYSADGAENGLFTEKLLEVWQDGAFEGDYWQFNKEVLKRMPVDQSPGIMFIGFKNLGFEWAKPFVIR